MKHTSRREAMQILAAGGVALGVPSLALGGPEVKAGPPDLVEIYGPDPRGNVNAAIKALGGMQRFVSRGDKVVVKPNMGFGNPPNRATTTEPMVVRAVVEQALEAGAKRVLVLDNPCHKADIVLEVCGISKALKGLPDTFIYTVTRDSLFKEVALPKGQVLKKQKVAIDILEADSIIAVPVAKSHGSAMVSFGMKGWMGVVLERKHWHVWVDLHKAIADIATFVRPKLTVLDATRALVTGGPGGPGKVEHLKKIVAGTDPVAVDTFGVTLAKWGGTGYRVEQVPSIMHAAALGVGTRDLSKLQILKTTA